MVDVSMLELVRTGKLGRDWLGMPRLELQHLLGVPPDWGSEKSRSAASIWRYGDVEFHFDDGQVFLVFSDHANLTNGGGTLRIASWIIHRGLPLDHFEIQLRQLGINYTATTHPYDPALKQVLLESGVSFTFIDQPECDSDDAGLVAWCIRRS